MFVKDQYSCLLFGYHYDQVCINKSMFVFNAIIFLIGLILIHDKFTINCSNGKTFLLYAKIYALQPNQNHYYIHKY